MDYVVEARRFIQRAVDADHPEVTKEHLRIALWFLCQLIEESDVALIKRRHKKAETLSDLSK